MFLKLKQPRITRIWRGYLCLSLLVVSVYAQSSRDVSKESARPVRDWVRVGVIYEIYPRAFSPQGNFNAITARLDELKDLGVTILWLMPIHPIGRESSPANALRGCLTKEGAARYDGRPFAGRGRSPPGRVRG